MCLLSSVTWEVDNFSMTSSCFWTSSATALIWFSWAFWFYSYQYFSRSWDWRSNYIISFLWDTFKRFISFKCSFCRAWIDWKFFSSCCLMVSLFYFSCETRSSTILCLSAENSSSYFRWSARTSSIYLIWFKMIWAQSILAAALERYEIVYWNKLNSKDFFPSF